MKILGLHFGHDAGACVLDSGEIKSFVLRERISRIKHAISLDMQTIDLALHDACLAIRDIDCVAICSTQFIDLIIDNPIRFNLKYADNGGNHPPSAFLKKNKSQKQKIKKYISREFLDVFYDESYRETLRYNSYKHFFPEHKQKAKKEISTYGIISEFLYPTRWEKPTRLCDLRNLGPKDVFLDEELRLGFHFPATVTIDGVNIPAFILSHHACHAASTFFNSGFDEAGIFTNDGYGVGNKDLSGLFFYGIGNKIYPLWPHHLVVGHLYEMVGNYLGLGEVGSAGKLMGLAPYGQPNKYQKELVGNHWDWEAQKLGISMLIERLCGKKNLFHGQLRDLKCNKFLKAANAAASTQKLFEEIILSAVQALNHCLKVIGSATANLCLSGGSALNCPSNSRILEKTKFNRVFVEPGCDDSGLAAGAALFTYYNLYEKKRKVDVTRQYNPYLGPRYLKQQICEALIKNEKSINSSVCKCPAVAAAKDLSQNKVVGWFQGRSEIGPRALGARSLLADPRIRENWKRLNEIKQRELWRPFAPAVLYDEVQKYFKISQLPSPFMLFNASVESKKVPAVTHVDSSSRIQTVCKKNGLFYKLIKKFYMLTDIPVVLNTSLNGPGEPIAETPSDAIKILLNTEIDVMYIENFRLTKI